MLLEVGIVSDTWGPSYLSLGFRVYFCPRFNINGMLCTWKIIAQVMTRVLGEGGGGMYGNCKATFGTLS
jgi:hypothetical protein